jgi:hypothetical protein
MSFLHAISPLSREGLRVLATVVVSLLALWLCGLFSRRRFIVIKRSEETELIAYQLRRIADATERLSSSRETHPPRQSAQADTQALRYSVAEAQESTGSPGIGHEETTVSFRAGRTGVSVC